MSGKRITSSQVARKAGVSRTTVSLVLNNVEGTNISEATRKRVMDAATSLGYVPNEAARSLARGHTKTIGFIICQPTSRVISDAYIPQLIHGINAVTREYDFRILIDWVEDVSTPDAYINLAKAKKIDGILLSCPRSDDQQLLELINDNFPVVLLGSLPDKSKTHSVDVDNHVAAGIAVQHLIDLGHKRIACITNAPLEYIMADERLQGYKNQLESSGIMVDSDLIQYGNFNPESGYEAMMNLLRLPERPTAVFVASDVVAFGALAAIRDQGFRVPEDIALVSYDDVPMARYVDPPLTSIHIPAIEQGRRAVTMLIDLIRGIEPAETQIELDYELVVRQSCGSRHEIGYNTIG